MASYLRRMVQRHGTVAYYLQIANDLQRKIEDGGYSPDEDLPTEDRLADEHGVSRSTVRRALAMLKSEGLIDTERGRRAWVRGPRRKDLLWLRGGEPAPIRMPTAVERATLGVPPGVPVYEIGRRLYPGDRYVVCGGDSINEETIRP